MDNFGLGAGLASIAFWGFLSVAVIAGIWEKIRKRDAQHETVRRMIESGQPLNQEILDKLVNASKGGSRRLDRDLKLTAMYTLPAAVGLAVFGMILGTKYPKALLPLLGAAALVGCIGIGFLVAAKIVERWYVEDDPNLNRL